MLFIYSNILFITILYRLLLLRITGEGEVFYVQQRVGYRGSRFGLIKFATMLKASQIWKAVQSRERRSKYFRLGSFAANKNQRVTQLLNVLLGDMSLIAHVP